MPSTRDIKNRIKSVQNTRQITKAMNLVAASKLNKAKSRLDQTLPFLQETKRIMASIAYHAQSVNHPFLHENGAENALIIVIAGDRGLCGGYNVNVSKPALALMDEKPNSMVLTIGMKARDYFRRRGRNVVKSFTGISENPFYEDALAVGEVAVELFETKQVGSVWLSYTMFQSALTQTPTLIRMLPVDPSGIELNEDDLKAYRMMNYEPSAEAALGQIIPKYINTRIFSAMVEAAACELGARMTAMDSATENADELIGDLGIIYNRARQAAITQEINEIVGGANAL